MSFIVGLLVDKFRYHLPLYRQHQRLLDAGFTLSRPWQVLGTKLTPGTVLLSDG